MEVIEAKRVSQRFTAAAHTYDQHAAAQQRICAHLLAMLKQQRPLHFQRVLEIGCGSGGFTRLLQAEGEVGEWCLNDLCESWSSELSKHLEHAHWRWLGGDAERLAFPGSFDLIASANALQWMRELPAFLRRLSASLAPQGLLLFNLFASDNLLEVKAITGQGLTYPSPSAVQSWLEKEYRILRMEEERIVLTFADPMEVLRHLKYTGVTANATGVWTKGKQAHFCEAYRERFATAEGKVTLTYAPLYLLASKS